MIYFYCTYMCALFLSYCLFSSAYAFIFFFFLNDPAPPEISPLPHHAPLPICGGGGGGAPRRGGGAGPRVSARGPAACAPPATGSRRACCPERASWRYSPTNRHPRPPRFDAWS